MENPNAKADADGEENPNDNDINNPPPNGDATGNQRRRTPFTDLSQVDSDLALARTLQEQERAYMMLRMDGGDGSDYGSWETGSYGHDDDADHDDYDDASEEDNNGTDVELDDDVDDDAEDVFDVYDHAEVVEDEDQNIELDPSAFSSDEAYARALQDAEEREMAARLLALAGINDMIVGEGEDEDDRGGNSQDAWDEVDPDELSYEELLALGEVVGTESRGLSADTIASLPSVNYKSQGIQDGMSDSCVICRLDYEDGDTLTVLACKHSYHSECINNWLQINKVCPVCSTEVSTSGKSYCSSHLNQIHALLISSGLSSIDPFASKFLSTSFNIDYIYRFFLHLPNPTIFHYNAVIRAFSNSKNPHKSILTFLQMLRHALVPDHLTYPFLVKASSRLLDLKLGGCIHGHVLRKGFASDLFISNSLIHMYGACGEMQHARQVFDEMPSRNLVSWNSMLDAFAKCGDVISMRSVFDMMHETNVVSWSSLIDGYVKDGNYMEALSIFLKMREKGPDANEVTMVSVLCACSHLGALELGRSMHQYIVENGLKITLVLRTSLVDMYAKCGAIEEALTIFREVSMRNTDVLIWNAIIGGLATHGHTVEALEIYKEMQDFGIKPDEITYLCLLNACSHGGMVKEAWKYLNSIATDNMVPKNEHYACMVDVLARAGHLVEAYQLVSQMPTEPTASILGALFTGCINHRKFNLAEAVGKKLIELEPNRDGRYIGLSNVYAITKCWDEARSTREAMEIRGVKKFPGYSFVEVLGDIHRFIAHDENHPESQQIYLMLDVIVEHMKLSANPVRLEIICTPTPNKL